MGPVLGFEGGVSETSGSSYDGYSSVNVYAQNTSERWAVMSMISISGGLDHPSLVPGARLTFDSSSWGYGGDGTELFFSVVGCSGPEPSVWEFDQPAEEVQVQVEAGAAPGQVDVRYR